MDSGLRRSDESIPKPPQKRRRSPVAKCAPNPPRPHLRSFQPRNLPGPMPASNPPAAARATRPAESQNPENPRQNDDTAPLPPPNPLRHTQSMSGGKEIRFRQSPKEGNGHSSAINRNGPCRLPRPTPTRVCRPSHRGCHYPGRRPPSRRQSRSVGHQPPPGAGLNNA